MNIKLKTLMLGTGLVMSALSSSAMAGVVWYSPFTAFQDDSLDYVVDTNSNGTIDQGDRLISVAEFVNTQGVLPGQGPSDVAPDELTAIADITVTSVDPGTGALIFGASGAGGVLSSFTAGTTLAFFLDTAADLNVINAACGTRANCLALGGLGADATSSLFFTAGFYGDVNASWVSAPAAGGATIATVQSGSSSATFGSFNFALDIANNNTGQIFGLQDCNPFCLPGGDGMTQLTGSGNILGGQFLNPAQWTARDDADVQVSPVPEPTTLGLFGVSLLALAYRRRTQTLAA